VIGSCRLKRNTDLSQYRYDADGIRIRSKNSLYKSERKFLAELNISVPEELDEQGFKL
jgi:hypothetical protein